MRTPGPYIAGIVGGVLILGAIGWELARPEPTYQGHNARYWAKQLDNPSEGGAVRIKAVAAMREMGAAAIPYLTVAPRPEDTRLKYAGDSIYHWLAPHFPRAMRKKLPFYASGGIIVGSGCAAALGSMGPKARGAVPTLLRWLDDPDANICDSAFIALLQIAPDDAHVINALLQKLKTTTGFTHFMLLGNPARYYDEINPRAVAVIPLLLYGLEESDTPYVRANAAAALGRFGGAAAKSKPELEAAMKDSSVDVQTGAAIGLWRLDGRLDPTLETLNKALQTKNTLAQWKAVAGLAEIGAPAKGSLPLLIPLLEDTNAFFRAAVSNAIQKIDPNRAEEIFHKTSISH